MKNELKILNKTLKELEKEQKLEYLEFQKKREISNSKITDVLSKISEVQYKLDELNVVKPTGCNYDKSGYYPIFIQLYLRNGASVKVYKQKLKQLAEKIDGRKQNLSGFQDTDKKLNFNWIFKSKKGREKFLLYVFNTFGGGDFSSSDLSDVEMMGS